MSNFKFVLFAASILFAITATSAEESASNSNAEPSTDIRFGARLGFNLSSLTASSDRYVSYSLNDVFGWQIGGAVDIPLKVIKMGSRYGLINIQPDLMLVSKGGESSIWLISTYEVSAYYLELPVSGSFKFIVSPNFSVRVDAGPYFAFGLFGKQKFGSWSDDTFGSGGLSRFDFGAQYGVAIEFFDNYYLCLKNSSGFTSDNVSSFYSTIGYNF
jgi:hypothetical protein